MENTGQFCFTHPSGKDIYLYSLRNAKGSEVQITNYGAILMAYKVCLPGRPLNDIVLGFHKVQDYLRADYLQTYPFMGAAVGRYANRIKNASFKIDGHEYPVSKNWGKDQLHGGFEGFDKKVWDFVSFDEKSNVLQFNYKSPDGEEGFPGNLDVSICYELNDENDLIFEYSATCDQATAINLTHHGYFNLNNGSGTILDHEVRVFADKILEQDAQLIPTGRLLDVKNTRFDFEDFHSVGERIEDGYDQSFVVDKKAGQLSVVAELQSKKSGLRLQVLTTEPMVHLYTGQGFPKISGKSDEQYGPYSGLCLETQKHPNAINIPEFPNTVLRPGEKYHQKNVYKISELA